MKEIKLIKVTSPSGRVLKFKTFTTACKVCRVSYNFYKNKDFPFTTSNGFIFEKEIHQFI